MVPLDIYLFHSILFIYLFILLFYSIILFIDSIILFIYSIILSKKLIDRNWLKKFMQVGVDVTCCTPILVGVTSPVSEILLLSKTAKFPFLTMDYSPWSSKNLIDRNWLKKFMQVGVDTTCMYIDLGGCDFSSFGDIATLKNSHGHQKF